MAEKQEVQGSGQTPVPSKSSGYQGGGAETVGSGLEKAPAVHGAEQVQEKVDVETEKGYSGSVPDETPNENYTVAGVTSGAPTPETTKKSEG